MTDGIMHDGGTAAAGDGAPMGVRLLQALARARLVLIGALALGAVVGYGASGLVTPRFVTSTTLLPPQQQQSAAASALASIGSLVGLAGAAPMRSPGEQYVALMQTVQVSDRIVERFKLRDAFAVRFQVDAREELARRVRINLGRKDGLITVEVEDTQPERGAAIANQYVDELRRLTQNLAMTEAQQRRAFFEAQLKASREKLQAAQSALEASGFTPGALRAEPKAAAEGYAKLHAEVTAAEIRLQSLRSTLADETPEVRRQTAVLAGLRAQLSRVEQPSAAPGSGDYVGKYREFKYQEALFEVYARQFELARVDESREGALIQVVDIAAPSEKPISPRPKVYAALGSVIGLAVVILALVLLEIRAQVRALGRR